MRNFCLPLLSLLILFYLASGFISPVDNFRNINSSKLILNIDTNLVLYTREGKPLRYHQYMPLLKTGKYTIDRGEQITFIDGKSVWTRGNQNILVEVHEFQLKTLKMDTKSIDYRISLIFSQFKKWSFAGLDTNLIVYDESGKPLRFYQYEKLMYTGKYSINLDRGKRSLVPYSFGSEPDSIAINHMLYNSLVLADKVLVKKSLRKMYLIRGEKIIFEFPISLGKNPAGAKQKEGDGRTPEGLYYLDYNINSKATYHLGYHISYPNIQDIANAKKLGVKPGGDIMIHGTSPEKSKLKDWTNGCIAISNAHIDTLFAYVNNNTPIEIQK